MKYILAPLFFCLISNAQTPTTGTNKAIHQQEQIQRQKDADRAMDRLSDQVGKPNSPSTPTKVDTSTWGLDPDVKFEITNHLFGYSTLVESEQTLQGLKITGLVNLGFYSSSQKTATNRSQSRFVMGIEFPLFDITNRINAWSGVGLTLGDRRALYVDLGFDYRILNWLKVQAGANYNSDYGNVSPQVSIGYVW